MKIQPFVEKLQGTKTYEEFQQKYKGAFLIAGFFVLDYESGQNISQIDYYIPKEKKVAAFNISQESVNFKVLEMLNEKIPEKLDIKTNVDLDALRGILEDEMKNRSISDEIKKIIAVIQTIEGRKVWTINCVLSGMEILKAHVDDESKTVLSMERASVVEFLKKIPMNPAGQPAKTEPSKKDIDAQLKQLDQLKEVLEKEKAKLEKKTKK
ncbi:hypothetical protein AUJ84_01405 [Candidatus Pacearchaeota archaeon CG1_02_32_132]|nr:MAG: hypothetical protein AUJ84_01405 [Candidatus Pacearchaeota archaeon CG1_02_32_132]